MNNRATGYRRGRPRIVNGNTRGDQIRAGLKAGHTPTQIAREMGVKRGTVSGYLDRMALDMGLASGGGLSILLAL